VAAADLAEDLVKVPHEATTKAIAATPPLAVVAAMLALGSEAEGAVLKLRNLSHFPLRGPTWQ
jgi:hypothetical protein